MTAIVLGVVLLALIGAHVYLQRENAKERRDLMDRLTVPEAATAAAFARAIEAAPVIPSTDDEDDKKFGRDITADHEIGWIPVGGDI